MERDLRQEKLVESQASHQSRLCRGCARHRGFSSYMGSIYGGKSQQCYVIVVRHPLSRLRGAADWVGAAAGVLDADISAGTLQENEIELVSMV